MVVWASSVSQQSSQVVAYDLRDGVSFEYDVVRGRGRFVPAWTLRVMVASLLGLEPGEEGQHD